MVRQHIDYIKAHVMCRYEQGKVVLCVSWVEMRIISGYETKQVDGKTGKDCKVSNLEHFSLNFVTI